MLRNSTCTVFHSIQSTRSSACDQRQDTHVVNARSNRNVFNWRLNALCSVKSWSSAGNTFHALGPACEKPRLPCRAVFMVAAVLDYCSCCSQCHHYELWSWWLLTDVVGGNSTKHNAGFQFSSTNADCCGSCRRRRDCKDNCNGCHCTGKCIWHKFDYLLFLLGLLCLSLN